MPERRASVVVTYNALPWIERCLESVAGYETVVVDNGSTDGTVDARARALPRGRLVEQENLGLAARLERGHARDVTGRYFLILNADAWLADDALERLVAFADAHPRGGGRRPAAAAIPTGRCSARCAASRRCGGSRPSTCSCASSRRARSAERVLRRRLRPRRACARPSS